MALGWAAEICGHVGHDFAKRTQTLAKWIEECDTEDNDVMACEM